MTSCITANIIFREQNLRECGLLAKFTKMLHTEYHIHIIYCKVQCSHFAEQQTASKVYMLTAHSTVGTAVNSTKSTKSIILKILLNKIVRRKHIQYYQMRALGVALSDR